MKRIALAALLLGIASVNLAEDTGTGDYLLRACQQVIKVANDAPGADLYDANFCIGYARATYQAVSFMAYMEKSETYCEPDEVTVGQTVRIIVKYLEAHPETLHKTAFQSAFIAIVQAFPCEGK